MKENIKRLVLAMILLLRIRPSLPSEGKSRIVIALKTNMARLRNSIYTGAKLGSVALGNAEVN